MLPNIKALFFDIDNTLIDFHKSAYSAMCDAMAELCLEVESEALFAHFLAVNDILWKDVERGTLTVDRLHEIRWNTIFSRTGVDFDGVGFERVFRKYLFFSAAEVEGAAHLLRSVQGKYRIFAASNASEAQQRTRLEHCGMLDCFEGIFCSEQLGAHKPSRAFFDACFARAGGLSPAEVLLIGDSPSADIAGAKSCGMPACLYDPSGTNSGCGEDFSVRTLAQLEAMLI